MWAVVLPEMMTTGCHENTETKRCHGLTSSPCHRSHWPGLVPALYPRTCPVFLPGVNMSSEETQLRSPDRWGIGASLILCIVLFVARGTRGEARISEAMMRIQCHAWE